MGLHCGKFPCSLQMQRPKTQLNLNLIGTERFTSNVTVCNAIEKHVANHLVSILDISSNRRLAIGTSAIKRSPEIAGFSLSLDPC